VLPHAQIFTKTTGLQLTWRGSNDFITERGGNPEKVRESQRKRNAPVEIVDEVIADFEDHRQTQYAATQIGSQINALQKQVGQKKKAKEDATEILEEMKKLKEDKAKKEEEANEKLVKLNTKCKSIGNYVHDKVPVSNTEDDNAVVKTWAPENRKAEFKADGSTRGLSSYLKTYTNMSTF
jgi:seryl-tRNA synthetase